MKLVAFNLPRYGFRTVNMYQGDHLKLFDYILVP